MEFAMRIALLLLPSLFGCSPADEPELESQGLPVLGGGTNDVGSVSRTVVATQEADQLGSPRDLAFHPDDQDQLWVVNQRSQSTTIISDVGLSSQSSVRKRDAATGPHFHARPSALAMGIDTFATIHDTDELTQGPGGTPEDFMGPTLWPADADVFDAGHGSHLDMLHNSPLGKGIAWETDNTFWVFDGYHGAISRYAFRGDHDLGGADHSDGVVKRYVEGQVAADEGAPSHLEYHADSGVLYIADSGNGRVATLDTTGLPTSGVSDGPNYDGGRQEVIEGGTVETLATEGLQVPSGIALRDGLVFVTDAAAGTISAFDTDGNLIDWLDVGGTPNGIAFHDDGALFYIDNESEEVVRIEAL